MGTAEQTSLGAKSGGPGGKVHPALRFYSRRRERVKGGSVGRLAFHSLLQPGEHLRALQGAHEQNGNGGPAQAGDAKGEDVSEQGRLLGHDEGGQRVGGQRPQETGADQFAQIGQGELFAELVEQPAEQGAAHAAGEGEQAAGAQHHPHQAGAKGHADPVPGPEKDTGEDVDQVLYGKALGGPHWDGEGGTDDGDSHQQPGQGQLADTG